MTQLGRGDEAVVVAVEDLVPLLATRPSPSPVVAGKLRGDRTLKASRISSSESVSFIFLAIMVRNSSYHALVSGNKAAARRPPRAPPAEQTPERTREVDGAIVVGIDLVDHILQLRLGRVLTQRSHDRSELLCGDLSYTSS